MITELQWTGGVLPSALHAAASLLHGMRLVDERLADALAEPVAALETLLDARSLGRESLLTHLVPLSATITAPRELSDVVLRKALGHQRPPDAIDSLARLIGWIQTTFLEVVPKAAEELALRVTPLAEQWEARGPGLLAGVTRLVGSEFEDSEFLVERASVVLVQPVLGGGGEAHPAYNLVHFEAVLANPVAELPEVVRLGWLLSQLNLDLPKFQPATATDRSMFVGRLALVPVVLAAAENVELARCDPATLDRAIAMWQAGEASAVNLLNWWETYLSARPAWPVALAALDEMLATSS